jgi:2-keto-4-pentenoate hydratase/2-oxohepta-3-ene-1,7-dioic acid hydratase in catechol pathway
MKLVTYRHHGRTAIAAVANEQLFDLTAVAPDMLSLIEQGAAGLARAGELIVPAESSLPLAEARLLAPIPRPRRNIICLGLNYLDHAQESFAARGREVRLPDYPVFFTKATGSINGPYDDIPYDAAVSSQIDWEGELGVVIGRGGRNIDEATAWQHVFGYTVINDVSARDIQTRHGGQFFKGKSLDGSCPCGPAIVTADELPDPHQLRLVCRVNGVIKQEGHTGQMIFNIPAIIAHLSLGLTLEPGDLIATGTPAGVGFARQPAEFLRPGDVLETEIEGIGVLRNRVAGGEEREKEEVKSKK